MIHLFNKTEYSPFLQLSELNTQLSQTNQLKYAASAQPTQKSTAFTQLIRRSEKKPQHCYSFNAGLKKTQLLRSFFKKAAEKPAFTQLLRRAAFNFGKGKYYVKSGLTNVLKNANKTKNMHLFSIRIANYKRETYK